jgi:hypothetical protein
VTAANNELTATLLRHPRGWLILPVTVPLAGQVGLDVYLMLNTGRPQSALSRTTLHLLTALGHITSTVGSHVLIRNAQPGSVALPDISMRVSAGPALLSLEGMRGLDFLEQFAEVRIDFAAMRLTLAR